MESGYETILHLWFEELWNKGREETIDENMAEDCLVHGISDGTGQEVSGSGAFKTFFHSFRQAIPDIHITVEDSITAGDKTAARCRVVGTHSGEGLGFPATGKPVDFSGIAMVIVRDGKVVEAWNHFDFLNMYTQLGVIQAFNTEAVIPQ